MLRDRLSDKARPLVPAPAALEFRRPARTAAGAEGRCPGARAAGRTGRAIWRIFGRGRSLCCAAAAGLDRGPARPRSMTRGVQALIRRGIKVNTRLWSLAGARPSRRRIHQQKTAEGERQAQPAARPEAEDSII